METNTPEARAAIAREWLRSSLSQAEFAERHGIRPRTLREWCRKYAPSRVPVEEARRVVQDAIAKLHVVLVGLDVLVEEEGGPAACRTAAMEGAEVRAAPPVAQPARPASVPQRELPTSAGPQSPESPSTDAGQESTAPSVAPAPVDQRRARRKTYQDFM